MAKQTQKMWVVSKLKEQGYITRNTCLANRITRLSSIVQQLESEGYMFISYRDEGDYGYRLADRPRKLVTRVKEVGGKYYRYQEAVPAF